jgi:type I restriction enzyme S subunit
MSSILSSDLPPGWTRTTIGNVCLRPQYGWTTSATNEGSLRLLRTTDITKKDIDWDTVPFCKKNPPEPEKYLLRDGDIVVSRAGSVGHSGLIRDPPEAVFASYLIRFKTLISERYFSYFLKSPYYWDSVAEKSLGIALPNVNASKLKEISLPLAPLAEQKRIVSKIEALLARMNFARARLDKSSGVLEAFRQVVLAAACSGRLTEEWRKSHEADIKSASELRVQIATESQKTSKKKIKYPSIDATNLPKLPETWVWVTIGEVETFIGSGITPRGGSATYQSEGIPFVRSHNVWPSGLRLGDVAFISNEQHEIMSRTKIHPRDVLLNITGASIGRSTYVPEDFAAGNVNQHVSIIRTINSVHYKFLSNFLNSPLGQDEIFSTQLGVTRQGLNYDQIRSLVMPLTSFAEQIQIVKQLESSLRIINDVQRVTERSIKQTDRLKRIILKKAFEGRLVPNEAELANREGRSYEPASVLLERIEESKATKLMRQDHLQ